MKAITLRDIPEPIAAQIRERARQTGASLNRTVIEMLAERTSSGGPRVHHDLDHLAGTWTAEEADGFDQHLAAQRQIDAEEWT